MKKRLTAVFLAGIMALGFLTSCNTSGGEGEATRPPNSVMDPDGGNFISADYGGDDFTFLFIRHTHTGRDYYGGAFIDAESLNGGKINDSVFERNLEVEKKYNVNINERLEINGDPAILLQQIIMAGDVNFDAIYGWGYKLGACITENFFADFYNLTECDFEAEYWSPSAIEDLTVADKLYISINDISMNKVDWAGLLFYNKALAEIYGIDRVFGSPYDMVRDGTWTYEKYIEMIKAVSSDLDGDGAITRNDHYGLVGGFENPLQDCGIFYTKKEDDGAYTLNVYSEKALGIMQMINDVDSNSNWVKNYSDIWDEPDSSADGFSDEWEYARSYFTTDHALFASGSPNITNETPFRNMESDYGVLPTPKYDVTQKEYISIVSPLASLFAIPSSIRDDMDSASYERTAVILEYMAYKSNQILLPNYYDTVLKGQRINNEDDRAMLDIVRTSVRYETADMYDINVISDVVSSMIDKPSTATSLYRRNEKKMQNALDDFFAAVTLLD